MKPEDVERLFDATWPDAAHGDRIAWQFLSDTTKASVLRLASAIESHVRAETVVMCKANVVVDVEEEFRNGEFVRATASLDWSAVDAAVKAGSDG
jgi:hypothetical protein